MRRQEERWLAQHGVKRVYRSHARAWLVIIRLHVKDREVISRRRGDARFLVPYDCTWTDDWRAGRNGAVHVHIGHQRWKTSRLRRRVHFFLVWPHRRFILWPYYRARRRWRQYKKGKPWLTRSA